MYEGNILNSNQTELAIKEDRLIPVYHPLIDARSGELYGVEVLARIKDLNKGVLTPDRFITSVEGSYLVVPFTQTLMRRAIPVITALSVARPLISDKFTVSFNVTANILKYREFLMYCSDFTKNIPENIILALELTERSGLSYTEEEYLNMRELKNEGILFWLDDFGTGYSDFLALKSGLFDAIKIPREFIMVKDNCYITEILRQSITAIGKQLNTIVIAEGVEDIRQLNILRREGIDFFQGYFFSEPLFENELLDFLDNNALLQHKGLFLR